jgi:uroporphyrinogen-III synthase
MFPGLDGLRLIAFEGRRSAEMAELIRRHGGIAIPAPAMREVALDNNDQILDYLAALEARQIDVVVLLTGIGLRTLAARVAEQWPPERLAAALRRATLVARGPKPVAALRDLGLQAHVVVPEPHTWRELLATLSEHVPMQGRTVAVQEYGVTNEALLSALRARGATVHRVAIYAWALPEDCGPLRAALDILQRHEAEVVVFTSGNQVYSLFRFAEDEGPGTAQRLRGALQRVVIASIGPVCSEALREHGLAPDFEPEHPRMGALISELARSGRGLWQAKSGAGG